MAILSSWFFGMTEGGKFYAAGNVHDNPKFRDGEFITTSQIQMIQIYPDRFTIKTRNTSYDALFTAFSAADLFKDVFINALVENGLSKATAELLYKKAERIAKKSKKMAG